MGKSFSYTDANGARLAIDLCHRDISDRLADPFSQEFSVGNASARQRDDEFFSAVAPKNI